MMNRTMEEMTQAEVEKAIKHNMRASDNATEIVCDFFLDALEQHLYGWRWKCPNGPNCKYRHALPPGYRLKMDTGEKEDLVRETLEETLENLRREFAHRTDLTPVTKETFEAWKQKRTLEKEQELAQKAHEEQQATRKLSKVERQF